MVALTLVMALNFAAAASAQVPVVPSSDERRQLPHRLEQEVSTQAANVWDDVLLILDELDDSPGQLFPCEPVVVAAAINETNLEDPVDYDIQVRPECLPA